MIALAIMMSAESRLVCNTKIVSKKWQTHRTAGGVDGGTVGLQR